MVLDTQRRMARAQTLVTELFNLHFSSSKSTTWVEGEELGIMGFGKEEPSPLFLSLSRLRFTWLD